MEKETPTPEQLAKLPQWAQKHINDLVQERKVAVNALNSYIDNQTPSKFYVEDYHCLGEQRGPTQKRKYFDTRRITVEHAGIMLNVYCEYGEHMDAQSDAKGSIKLQWEDLDRSMRHIAMIPQSFQQVHLVARDNMRV